MVEGVRAGGGIGGTARLPADGTAAAGRFIVSSDSGPPARTTRPSSAAGIGLEAMLALQAIDESEERDREARKHGTAMLGALSRLQRAMLAAEDPAAALRALNDLTSDGPLASDPELRAILRAVTLRCRVELARRGPRS